MQSNKNSFSDHITDLCVVWWEWMKSDSKARNNNKSYKLRRTHAEKCESLIQREYELINKLNIFFEEEKDE